MTDPRLVDLVESVIVMLHVALAYGSLGLWWGERGRRIAAERWKVHGDPTAPQAASAVMQPVTPEERAANLGISQESINKGADNLQAMAKEAGRPMSRKDALAQARMMLYDSAPIDMGGL